MQTNNYHWVESTLAVRFDGLWLITTSSSHIKLSDFFRNKLEGVYAPIRNYIPETDKPYLQKHNLIFVMYESMDPHHTLWEEGVSATVVYFNMTRNVADELSVEYVLKELEPDDSVLIQFINWFIQAIKEGDLSKGVF